MRAVAGCGGREKASEEARTEKRTTPCTVRTLLTSDCHLTAKVSLRLEGNSGQSRLTRDASWQGQRQRPLIGCKQRLCQSQLRLCIACACMSLAAEEL